MAIIGPNLCMALVIGWAGHMIAKLNNKAQQKIEEKDDFSMLDVLHHFTAGVKAFATEHSYSGQDELRQACGGAGFLLASGVAQQWKDGAPLPTFEGVNVLMYAQAARYIFKQVKWISKREKPAVGYFTYLNYMTNLLASRCTATQPKDFVIFENLN